MRPDNSIVVGDVVLMRMPKDRFLMLKRRREERQRAMEASVTSGLRELGEQYRDRGIIVHTNVTPSELRQQLAANRAGTKVDQWIREGRMPGVPAPGTP